MTSWRIHVAIAGASPDFTKGFFIGMSILCDTVSIVLLVAAVRNSRVAAGMEEGEMKNRIAVLRGRQGLSQAELAERLSISRQTVNALERSKTDPGLGLAMRIAWLFKEPVESIFLADMDEKMVALKEIWEFKSRSATALNEVEVLSQMGDEGWEMVGFGIKVLKFRRPQNPELRIRWMYNRIQGILASSKRSKLESDDWLYCGSWMGVFHYFKREAL